MHAGWVNNGSMKRQRRKRNDFVRINQ